VARLVVQRDKHLSPSPHAAELRTMSRVFADVKTTEEVVEMLEQDGRTST